jgi:hypothetical protein
MTVDITPEPAPDERAALEALVAEPGDGSVEPPVSNWRRAALDEAVGAEDPYGFAPGL